MKLLSVNVGRTRSVPYQGRMVATGIFKEPVGGRVMVRSLGVDGDEQADKDAHGGLDQAVYGYPFEQYALWQKELNRTAMPYGQFGENLTLGGLPDDAVRVGDVLRIGDALLQVTQPRIPCYKLALRLGADAAFPKRFRSSGKVGYYLRVLQEGAVGAGDSVVIVDSDATSITIAEFMRTYTAAPADPAKIDRLLAARGLAAGWRDYFAKVLEKGRTATE
jgi:MOSC domain-containing protein YiiM